MRLAKTVAFLLVLSLPAAAVAQQALPSSFASSGGDRANTYIHLSGGRNFGGNYYEASDVDKTNTFGGGVTLLGKHIVSLELNVGYTDKFFDDDPDLGANSVATVTGSVIVGPWLGRVRPYLVAGGGLMRARIEGLKTFGGPESTDVAVATGGAGFLLMVTRNIGMRGDARYHWAFASADDQWWGGLSKMAYLGGTAGLVFAF